MRLPQLRHTVCVGLAMACAFLALQRVGQAQQTVPFDGGIPVAPAGFEPQPIPAEPIEFDTAEVMRIRVVPVARQLVNPWSLAFLPDGSLLLGQTGRGWQAKGGKVAALQHVTWDGKTVAPQIVAIVATPTGFRLDFTQPLGDGVSQAILKSALSMESWVYRDAPDYGSPELDEHPEEITRVELSPDRRSLRAILANTVQPKIHPEQTPRVYQLSVASQDLWGKSPPGFEAFYTLYEFPTAP